VPVGPRAEGQAHRVVGGERGAGRPVDDHPAHLGLDEVDGQVLRQAVGAGERGAGAAPLTPVQDDARPLKLRDQRREDGGDGGVVVGQGVPVPPRRGDAAGQRGHVGRRLPSVGRCERGEGGDAPHGVGGGVRRAVPGADRDRRAAVDEVGQVVHPQDARDPQQRGDADAAGRSRCQSDE
jgi:hypothetical protein